MNEISIESKECISTKELIIQESVFSELGQRTQEHQPKGEFWVYLLGKNGVVENLVDVGQGGESFISNSVEEDITKLRPFIENGFQILGDYHNHPKSCLKVYKAVGLPHVFVTAPSGGDLGLIIPRRIQVGLHQQQPYPKIIGTFLEEQGFIVNCFNVLRQPTSDEMNAITFPDPHFTPAKSSKTGIQVIGQYYTDPRKLNELEIVKPVTVKVLSKDGKLKDIPNAYSF